MHPREHEELRHGSSRKPAAIDDEALLTSTQVRALIGNVSSMAIWRWQRDPRVQFPKPDLVLNSRRYWRLGTIRQWRAAHAEVPA